MNNGKHYYCKRCGRELKRDKSVEQGYGDRCYEKVHGKPKRVRKHKQLSVDGIFLNEPLW